MDPTVRRLGTRYRRLRVGVVILLAVLALVGGVAVDAVLFPGRDLGFPVLVAIALVLYFAPLVPVLRVRDRIELATDEPPVAVREEFQGPDCPVTALVRSVADEVVPLENGGRILKTSLLRQDREVRYEARGQPDGRIVVVLSKDGSRVSRTEVTVEATDTGSRVRLEGTPDGRVPLFLLITGPIRMRYLRRILGVYGYEITESKTRIAI